MVGDVIARLRTRFGMTQTELANLAGVSLSTVKNWETGNTDPHVENIKMLSNIFKVDANYLLEYDDKNTIYFEELEENDIILLNYIIQYMVNEKRKQNRK